jgi:orotidine-5'-phosphate decarboxylase
MLATSAQTLHDSRTRIIANDSSVIVRLNMLDLNRARRVLAETSDLEEIGGYKVGPELAMIYGLPRLAEAIREYTTKPLIYDHQKAGTDTPHTAKKFMKVMKFAKISRIILFPQAGPQTEKVWIQSALDSGLKVMVGGIMTHDSYLTSEGGYITDEGAYRIYKIAAKEGITNFVVPGTKPEIIKNIVQLIAEEGVTNPIFYAPGFGKQRGSYKAVKAVLGSKWHAIVGEAICNPGRNLSYRNAAKREIELFLRS